MFMIQNLLTLIRAALHRENGQALAETTLVLAFIALVCILALTAIGLAVSGSLNDFAAAFGISDSSPPVVVNN